jgi:hypothetical protein
MDMAKRLLDGKFHEMEEEDEQTNMPAIKVGMVDASKSMAYSSREELDKAQHFEGIEAAIRQIFKDDEVKRKKFDEIPKELRHEFDLPQKMGIYEIDFNEIRKYDISKKKQKPMWSGQDVFPDQLDYFKSKSIISKINRIRVWPQGFKGLIKRARFLLRIMVKSSLFDNSMTFAVLLNTITLSIDHYGIDPEVLDLLDVFNLYFTWIFIFEMMSKILAVGIGKYSAEKMNYLDGGVVILSVFEMVSEAILSGQGEGLSLSAFKTVRMLRTFRVFRIARLLRAL